MRFCCSLTLVLVVFPPCGCRLSLGHAWPAGLYINPPDEQLAFKSVCFPCTAALYHNFTGWWFCKSPGWAAKHSWFAAPVVGLWGREEPLLMQPNPGVTHRENVESCSRTGPRVDTASYRMGGMIHEWFNHPSRATQYCFSQHLERFIVRQAYLPKHLPDLDLQRVRSTNAARTWPVANRKLLGSQHINILQQYPQTPGLFLL